MLQSLRDQPNTLREYETIYIVKPDSTNDQLHELNKRVRRIIDDGEGKLLRVENWGKRKLAYEIKNCQRGVYLYWRYLAQGPLIRELERNLRMVDGVIRFLTVKLDKDVDPDARPDTVTEEVFASAAETMPDEEDYYLGRTRQQTRTEDTEDTEEDAELSAADTEEDGPPATSEQHVTEDEVQATASDEQADNVDAKTTTGSVEPNDEEPSA